MAKKPATKADTFDFETACEFGKVGIGDETANLSVTVARENIKLSEIDKFFCGKRLEGKIGITPKPVKAPKGNALPGLDDAHDPAITNEISTTFDVKRAGISPKKVSFSITFALSTVDVETLAHFAKRPGLLGVSVVGVLDEDEAEEE